METIVVGMPNAFKIISKSQRSVLNWLMMMDLFIWKLELKKNKKIAFQEEPNKGRK